MPSTASRLLAGTAALSLAAVLAACSDSDSTSGSGSSGGSSSDGAFPVTIPNAFGETTIESEPERVVVTGYVDVDTVLDLGVTPVAFQQFVDFPDAPVDGIGPWAEDLLPADADIQVFPVTDPPSSEDILALDPDLVIAIGSGMEQDEYDQLSELVPVLARPEGSTAYSVDRDDATLMIGKALGREDAAQQLIDDVDADLATAREDNADLAGKTFSVVVPASDGTGYSAYVEGDNRTSFLTDLGLELAPDVAALDTDTFFVTVSTEQANLLDADLIVVPALYDVDETRSQLESDPVFSALPAVQAGHVLYLDPNTSGGALTFNTTASVPYALDDLLPKIAQALAA